MPSNDSASREVSQALVPTLVGIGLVVALVSSLGAPLIPTIAHEHGVRLATADWVLTASLLTGALATPIMGRLADGAHQRRVIAVTLSLVLFGCIISALAPTFSWIVLGRGFQGIGLGLLPVNMAIARRVLGPQKSHQAIATLSVSTAIGAGLGYPATSAVAQLGGVSAAYWFGAFMVAIATIAAMVIIPKGSLAHRRPFDGVGALLLGISIFSISAVLSEGAGWGWTSLRSCILSALAVIALCCWIPVELRHRSPLVELRYLKVTSVAVADLIGFAMSVAMYLVVPVIVEFVQTEPSSGYGFGVGIVTAGFLLTPLSLGTYLASRTLIPMERALGTRVLMPLGSLTFATAALFFLLFHRELWQAYVAVGIIGLGIGLTFAAMPSFIIRAVPAGETGSATGLYQVLRNVGLAVGSSLSAGLLRSATPPGAAVPGFSGYQAAFLTAMAIGILTAVITYLLGDAPKSQAEVERLQLATRDEGLLEASGALLLEESIEDDETTS
jgi:predicted MFS family arabinose efflux permease